MPAGSDPGNVGTQLLALALRAEAQGTDPETALRLAARAYRDAIRTAETSPDARTEEPGDGGSGTEEPGDGGSGGPDGEPDRG